MRPSRARRLLAPTADSLRCRTRRWQQSLSVKPKPDSPPQGTRPDMARLRRFWRRKRQALDAEQQQRHAAAVTRHALAHLAGDETVGIYFARDGEVDLTALANTCWQRQIAVGLPVVIGHEMSFAAYRRDAELRDNGYGIPEPAIVEEMQPSVIFAPLVAFGDHGERLGMGGGYYDRYFASAPNATRIGVAHACQRADTLPANPWDVPLQAVITEDGWRWFQPPRQRDDAGVSS